MKKYILLVISSTALISSCGGGNSTTQGEQTSDPATHTEVFAPDKSNPDYIAGVALVKNSDCFSCHHETKKLIGPSYKDIAAKFPNNDSTIQTLAAKIMKGSKGDWGDAEMTPHPELSKADAEQMAKYIMVLKAK